MEIFLFCSICNFYGYVYIFCFLSSVIVESVFQQGRLNLLMVDGQAGVMNFLPAQEAAVAVYNIGTGNAVTQSK